MKIFEGQFTVIELPVGKNFIGQVLNQALNASRRRVFQGSRGRFHDIRQHHQTGLLGLRPGAGISVIIDIDGISAFELLGLFVKISD